MGDEQSRQETYRGEHQAYPCPCAVSSVCTVSSVLTTADTEAAEWAKKAQICFNECVRALQPHWVLLKRDELEACEDLQNTGLLQAVQLYKLMYGGKVLAMGITRASPLPRSVRLHVCTTLTLVTVRGLRGRQRRCRSWCRSRTRCSSG